MDLIGNLLPTDAPYQDRIEQLGGWLRAMGYEPRHWSGFADDRDWDVTFTTSDPTDTRLWTYHSDTRQGLAKTLVRYVYPHGAGVLQANNREG